MILPWSAFRHYNIISITVVNIGIQLFILVNVLVNYKTFFPIAAMLQ